MTIIQIRKKSIDFDKDAIRLLARAFIFAIGSYGIKAILITIGLSKMSSLGSLMVYLYWGVCLLAILAKNTFLIKKIVVGELLYFSILILNYLFFSKTRAYFGNCFVYLRQIMIVYLPCGIVCSQIRSFNDCWDYMEKYAYVGIIIAIMSLLFNYVKVWTEQIYGAQLLPFFFIVYNNCMGKRDLRNIAILIICFILLFFGGRQSLVIAIFGAVSFSICKLCLLRKIKKAVVCSILFLLFALFVFLTRDLLSSFLSRFFSIWGLNSRVANAIINNKLFDASNRTLIYQRCLDFIEKNKWHINGLLGDRVYLKSIANWIAYPHNLFLECLMDYGAIWGGLLIIILFIAMGRFFVARDRNGFNIFFLLFFVSFVRLLVSSSFVTEGTFYIFIPFLFNVTLKNKRRKIKKWKEI